MDILLIGAPIAATGTNVAVHLWLARTPGRQAHLASIIVAFLAGLCVLAAITGWAVARSYPLADSIGYGLLNLAAYGGLGYCYFTVVNLAFTSLRIRMIRALSTSPEGRLSLPELKRHYDIETILSIRLRRLAAWRQVSLVNERYYVPGKPGFLLLDRAIRKTRSVLGLGPSISDLRG